jgi:hypothetical protein
MECAINMDGQPEGGAVLSAKKEGSQKSLISFANCLSTAAWQPLDLFGPREKNIFLHQAK